MTSMDKLKGNQFRMEILNAHASVAFNQWNSLDILKFYC